jgi:hypothetical protein
VKNLNYADHGFSSAHYWLSVKCSGSCPRRSYYVIVLNKAANIRSKAVSRHTVTVPAMSPGGPPLPHCKKSGAGGKNRRIHHEENQLEEVHGN